MPRTHSKPQQQTLSIRVSESLREFLELSRQVIANGQGDSVSISDVAKVLLESARADRLDFRLEVAELQQSPTAALGQIRRKWEQQQPLSRAEWVLLAHYIQVACENLSGNTTIPSADSFIAVLEALLAVRSLRNDRGSGLDRFYLGNLAVPVGVTFIERHFDPELVPQVVGDLMQGLRGSASTSKVAFAGRNLYVALRDEVLCDIVALNRSLSPLLGKLFRLASRGHWLRERRPLRVPRELPLRAHVFELSSAGPFQAAASVDSDGELELLLTMNGRGVRYPLGPYPEIRELEAMLHQLDAGQIWDGLYFSASGDKAEAENSPVFHFCRRTDRVVFTFSEGEWRWLKELVSAALGDPKLRSVLNHLSLEYGEI